MHGELREFPAVYTNLRLNNLNTARLFQRVVEILSATDGLVARDSLIHPETTKILYDEYGHNSLSALYN
jgi:hypothetical protein